MTTGSFGYPSSVFKVISKKDGCPYCLRRFDNIKSVSQLIASMITDRWSAVHHPGICTLFKCFTPQRNTCFFVHEYCSGAQSLRERYLIFNNDDKEGGGILGNNVLISEGIIWMYITQLVSILRYLHGRGLACRSLQASHVLLVDGGGRRLRVSCIGVEDALEYEARKPILDMQKEDV